MSRNVGGVGITWDAIDWLNEHDDTLKLTVKDYPRLSDTLKKLKVVPNDARLIRGFEPTNQLVSAMVFEHRLFPEVREAELFPTAVVTAELLVKLLEPKKSELKEVPMPKEDSKVETIESPIIIARA